MGVLEEGVMRAQFHLSADFEVHVENEPGGVRLSTFRGTCVDHVRGDTECPDVKIESWSLNRQHARAIASAMMGCAQER
jgi:hypothetical protein